MTVCHKLLLVGNGERDPAGSVRSTIKGGVGQFGEATISMNGIATNIIAPGIGGVRVAPAGADVHIHKRRRATGQTRAVGAQ